MPPRTQLVTALLSAVAVLVAVVGVGVLGPAAVGALGPTTPQTAAAGTDPESDSGPESGSPAAPATRALPDLPGPLTPPDPQGQDAQEESTPSAPEPDGGQPPAEARTGGGDQATDHGDAGAASEPDPEPTVLNVGDSGPEVVELQQRLQELGYWLGGVNGTYDHLTRQAVIAFQGVEGLPRDGLAGPQVRGALPGAERPTPAAHHANGLEIDLQRQVLKVVENGQVMWTLHTSTGTGERYTQPDGDRAIAATPTGEYAIERRIDGWRVSDLGRLYRPAYFVGGIAIHGYHDVPPYPASHGCARVAMETIDFLWSQGYVDVGRPVVVH